MKVAALIPARFASSRYPGKPLVELRGAGGHGKPLIRRSFEAAQRVHGLDSIHVVTDDARIAEACAAFGAPVLMTSEDARNGTERCAEALDQLDGADVVVNIQGDALLTPAHFVEALVERMRGGKADVATPAMRMRSSEARMLQDEERAGRVGGTSVVTDSRGRALYFSKRLIPHLPKGSLDGDMSPVRLHIGVYAYTPSALAAYADTPPSELELLEGLEQLRFLTAGIAIDVVDVQPPAFALRELNNPEDVDPIEQALAEAGFE
ncbi:3-deoxy-manno-octulosonate cytidylyltransferase [Sphingomonas sabuli]|uniref:3-deoxy-manno-octulosonate cytidylyltransferase n=1 Tax=Sphingomonas sabuli TaxID=2764186 RepID=A0A7G9L356_9SPHN|nr:manno-octulosonate cytidylyltransferase [Sphingomonas sabuli]QNM83055.1 3-deoxy-manno-octulosonate cytidylyltransferase [Sphingomonas sabuli]